MGTVSSRGHSLLMPGSLSIDASQGFSEEFSTPNSSNDDADVMDHRFSQEEKQNRSDPLELIERALQRATSPELDKVSERTQPNHQQEADTCCESSIPPFISDLSKNQRTENTSDSSCSSSSSSSPPTPPLSIPIPPFPDMANVKLHSPSTNIVGTPFATNLTRFEYPFPPSGSSTAMSHFTSPASSSVSIAPSSASMTPFIPPSATLVDPITLSLVMPLPIELTIPRNCADVSLVHPKLRATPPPVPPSLLKKRKEKLQARRMTVDGSNNLGHDPLHHAYSDSNLHAKQRKLARNTSPLS